MYTQVTPAFDGCVYGKDTRKLRAHRELIRYKVIAQINAAQIIAHFIAVISSVVRVSNAELTL